MNKVDFEKEMENPKYGQIDRMHYIMKTDPSMMQYARDRERMIYGVKGEFESHVHELIKLRNKIFNTQQKFSIIDDPKKAGLDFKNVAKFFEYSNNFENLEEYGMYNVWNIRKKVKNKIFIDKGKI